MTSELPATLCSRYRTVPKVPKGTNARPSRSMPRHCFALLAEDGIALDHENGHLMLSLFILQL